MLRLQVSCAKYNVVQCVLTLKLLVLLVVVLVLLLRPN